MHSGCGSHRRFGESNSDYQSLGYESWEAEDLQGLLFGIYESWSEMLTVDSRRSTLQMCSFRLNKWSSIQPESYWPLQVQPRSLWLSFHVRRTRERFRRLLNAGNAIHLLLENHG